MLTRPTFDLGLAKRAPKKNKNCPSQDKKSPSCARCFNNKSWHLGFASQLWNKVKKERELVQITDYSNT